MIISCICLKPFGTRVVLVIVYQRSKVAQIIQPHLCLFESRQLIKDKARYIACFQIAPSLFDHRNDELRGTTPYFARCVISHKHSRPLYTICHRCSILHVKIHLIHHIILYCQRFSVMWMRGMLLCACLLLLIGLHTSVYTQCCVNLSLMKSKKKYNCLSMFVYDCQKTALGVVSCAHIATTHTHTHTELNAATMGPLGMLPFLHYSVMWFVLTIDTPKCPLLLPPTLSLVLSHPNSSPLPISTLTQLAPRQ